MRWKSGTINNDEDHIATSMISEYPGNVTFPTCGEISISAYEAGEPEMRER